MDYANVNIFELLNIIRNLFQIIQCVKMDIFIKWFLTFSYSSSPIPDRLWMSVFITPGLKTSNIHKTYIIFRNKYLKNMLSRIYIGSISKNNFNAFLYYIATFKYMYNLIWHCVSIFITDYTYNNINTINTIYTI